MDKKIAYYEKRSQIPNGSIVLCHGRSLLSKTIQWADSSYWNHSELVYWAGNRLMCIGANVDGVNPHFLSNVIEDYADFKIIYPNPSFFNQRQIDTAVEYTLDYTEKNRMEYDYFLLPRVLLARKLRLPVKRGIPYGKTICSMFTGFHYAKRIGVEEWVNHASKENFFTPQDHDRIKTDKFVEFPLNY